MFREFHANICLSLLPSFLVTFATRSSECCIVLIHLLFAAALAIHVSPMTKAVLDTFGTFELEEREEEVFLKVIDIHYLSCKRHDIG